MLMKYRDIVCLKDMRCDGGNGVVDLFNGVKALSTPF